MTCLKCGARLSEETKFCAKCGAQVGETENKPSATETPKANQKSVLKTFVGVLAFILAFVGFRYLISQNSSTVSESMSKQDIIKASVLYVRNNSTFPSELDEVTTWTGITEQTGAIRYEYAFHDADTSEMSDQTLKNYLTPTVCKSTETKSILDKNIDLQYFYLVTGSPQTYLVTINKADCI